MSFTRTAILAIFLLPSDNLWVLTFYTGSSLRPRAVVADNGRISSNIHSTNSGGRRTCRTKLDLSDEESLLRSTDHGDSATAIPAADRKELPGYSEEWQLVDALERCGKAMMRKSPFTIPSNLTEDSSQLWTEMPPVRPSDEDMAAPLEGLNRFAAEGIDGTFTGAAGVPLRYRLFPKYSTAEEGGRLRAGVVLLTGLMETMAKYGETIGYLNDRGWSVYTFDHHGQGLSGHLPPPENADDSVAHITNFQHYVDDLLHFSKVVLPATLESFRQINGTAAGLFTANESIAPPGCRGPATSRAERSAWALATESPCAMQPLDRVHELEPGLCVVGFSMGSLIATFAAVRDPTLFRKVVLVAPMFAPNTSGLPNALVGAIAWGVTKLGQGHRQDNGFTLGH